MQKTKPQLIEQSAKQPDRYCRLPETLRISGLGKTQLYFKVRNGTFPAPYKISARAVAWRESELQAWLKNRQRTIGEAA